MHAQCESLEQQVVDSMEQLTALSSENKDLTERLLLLELVAKARSLYFERLQIIKQGGVDAKLASIGLTAQVKFCECCAS